jgi:predicted TIM-barrel enzyme
MPRVARAEILARLRAMQARGEPIIGAGAGTGISAKGEERGGADLIVIYNSGRYRMAGRGSLAGMMPFGDANAVVLDMAREVLPVVARTPVLAGVCGTDPFRDMDVFLDEVARLGFSGVQNFPTVGLIDGRFRAGLEETDMGYAREVEMIAKAHARDLLTTPYVFDLAEAVAMAKAGADILVCHFGLTVGGAIGATTSIKLEDCPALTDAMAQAALAINPDLFILVHGGPIAEPEDAACVLARARHCDGFYGASSMERLPVERAITDQVAKFKAIKKPGVEFEKPAADKTAGGRDEHVCSHSR